MGALPGLLPLVLGGTEQPYIVNLLPAEDALNVRVVDPIRFSLKDTLLFLNAGSLRAVVSYAKTRSNGTALFEFLPRTKKTSVFAPVVDVDASFAVIGDGVQITKTSASAQRSVYASAVDIGGATSRQSALVTAIIRPDIETNNAQGAVLGLEYGPRNTGVYLFFQVVAGIKTIRVTGPSVNGLRIPNVTNIFDWTGLNRYIVFWNEMASPPVLEFYAEVGGLVVPFPTIPISTFQAMDPSQPSSTPRLGGNGDIVGIYGQEGAFGDQVTFKNIAVSADVGFPIISGIKRGEFVTTLRPDYLVRLPGDFDPREAPLAPWFDPPTPLFPVQDTAGSIAVLPGKVLQFSKPTAGQAFSVYREEPGILRLAAEAFFLEATIKGVPTTKDAAWAGSGFLFSDTANVYQLSLFDDTMNKRLGLLKRGGVENKQLDHFLSTPLDWSSLVTFRFVADPRRQLLEIFNTTDLRTPIMSVPFDRTKLPVIADYGYAITDLPFVAFGFPRQSQATGELDVTKLSYCYQYEAYEPARDALLPPAANPPWVLGDNAGTAVIGTGTTGLQIATGDGLGQNYSRAMLIDQNRGAVVEFDLEISAHSPNSNTGCLLAFDDGTATYGIGFLEEDSQKFVSFLQSAGGPLFYQLPHGLDGTGAKFSFILDWTLPHRYRLERHPHDKVEIFVDDEATPRLVIPDRISSPPVALVGQGVIFGHQEGKAATSKWRYIRTFSGGGFEVATRKNESIKDLRDELFDTQAVVLVTVSD